MAFSFHIFGPKRAKREVPKIPKVEIKTTGRIVFNKPAAELLTRINPIPDTCVLGYDPDNKAIGVLPLTPAHEMEDIKGREFNVKLTAKGAYIGAKEFFKSLGILPSSSVQVTPTVEGEFIAIKM